MTISKQVKLKNIYFYIGVLVLGAVVRFFFDIYFNLVLVLNSILVATLIIDYKLTK